jgi:PTS system nitrogen regulatory IIA component
MILYVKDVAKLLSLPEKTIYKWIKRNELPATKIGNEYRFNRVEILEWATSKGLAVSPDLFRDDPSPAVRAEASLARALKTGGIHYHVEGADRETVLRTIVETITLPPGTDKKGLADALIARENLCTTAIGEGIAIPHVRNPVVISIDSPVISLCFLERGVDFGALDKKPVDTVFTLFTPNVRTHLNVLSRLSFALHRAEIRTSLRQDAPPESIFRALETFEASLDQSPPEGHR